MKIRNLILSLSIFSTAGMYVQANEQVEIQSSQNIEVEKKHIDLESSPSFDNLIQEIGTSLNTLDISDTSIVTNMAIARGILYSVNIMIREAVDLSDSGGGSIASSKLHVKNFKLFSSLISKTLVKSNSIFEAINPNFSPRMNQLSKNFFRLSYYESHEVIIRNGSDKTSYTKPYEQSWNSKVWALKKAFDVYHAHIQTIIDNFDRQLNK
ncbi:hypothetical protein MJH12_10505 [bacterium]|nr:hypothetical protein [bacterium]